MRDHLSQQPISMATRTNLSDSVSLLAHLFLGSNPVLPCGDGTVSDAANRTLLDANGEGQIDLSDAVSVLQWLLGGGGPPVLGTECRRITSCPSACDA